MRSPQTIVEHIARLAARGFEQFHFVDNSFNIPQAYALELCEHLRTLQPRVRWRCILYPHRVEEKLVRAMADAGCVEAALGFESGSARVLRAMNKHFDAREVRQVSQRLATHGIRRIGFLLLGGPEEPHDSVEESLAFAESLRLDQLLITIGIRIYPATARCESPWDIGQPLNPPNGQAAGPCAVANLVKGNLQFQNNGAQGLISDNSINGNLQCQGNTPPPTGIAGSNRVRGHKQGQCSGL